MKKKESEATAEKQTARSRKKSHLPRMVRRMIAVLLVAALGLTAWTYRASLTPQNIKAWVQENLLGNSSGSGYPVDFSGNAAAGNFSVSEDSPALVTNLTFLYLNGNGKTRMLQQHGYTNPALKRCGDRFLILDVGGKGYRVSMNGTDFSETKNYDYTIFGGAIAPNGNYAIVSSSDGYTSQISVFNRSGQPLFEWATQTDLISAVCFSSDGRRIATASFTSQNGLLHAAIRIFSLDSRDAQIVQTFDEMVPLDIAFLSDETVLCVGDSAAVRISADGSVNQTYDYEAQALSAYAIHPLSGAVLALSASADGRSGTLVWLDSDFTAQPVTRFSQAVRDLDLTADQLLLLQPGTASRWSLTGTRACSVEVGTDCTRICADSGSGFFLLGVSEIRHEQWPEAAQSQ